MRSTRAAHSRSATAPGQVDFLHIGENHWKAVAPDTLCWPYGISTHRQTVAVADSDPTRARPGDIVILSGTLGDHGMAIMSVREGLEFETILKTDSAPLNTLVASLLQFAPHIHVLRDPTRGGLASSLNEIAAQSRVGVLIEERSLPILPDVQSACDLLGMDPVYVANEGKLVAIVDPGVANDVLHTMQQSPYGQRAAIIGTVTAQHVGMLAARTAIGGTRIIPLQIGEQIPHIC